MLNIDTWIEENPDLQISREAHEVIPNFKPGSMKDWSDEVARGIKIINDACVKYRTIVRELEIPDGSKWDLGFGFEAESEIDADRPLNLRSAVALLSSSRGEV